MSLIRENLMTRPGYSPYCGAEKCAGHWPRTRFNGQQFKCACGWTSMFDPEFIAEYKAKWATSPQSGAIPSSVQATCPKQDLDLCAPLSDKEPT